MFFLIEAQFVRSIILYGCFLVISLLCFLAVAGQNSRTLTPEMYGAKADGTVLHDGSVMAGSNLVTFKIAKFNQQDTDKIIFINGAEKNGKTLISYIKAIISQHSITISTIASTTVADSSVVYGTECTDAFIKLNENGRKISDKTVVISFRKGIYLTKFNNWLAGIKNIKVIGNGASFMCTHGAYDPDGFTSANQAFCMPGVFDNADNNYTNVYVPSSFGYTFKTARKGNDFVVLNMPDSCIFFKPGYWVLLGGFEGENFGGYPPLYRYFEYAKVSSIDTKHGLIRLDRTLVNNYDGDWPDSTWKGGTQGQGTPRILNCNRSTFTMIENIEMSDLNFLPFPCWQSKLAVPNRNGRISLYGFINGNFNNITMNAVYVSTCQTARFTKCDCLQYFEPDKEVTNLTLQNCKINNFVLGPGIENENLLNCIFNGKFSTSPRHLYLNENLFKTQDLSSSESLLGLAGNSGSDDITLGSNAFYSYENRKTVFGHGGFTKLTISKIINDSTVAVSFDEWGQNNNGRQVVPGKIGFTTNGKTFLVKRVFRYAPGNMAVQGCFSSNPKIGDFFIFNYLQNIFIEGKQVVRKRSKTSISLFNDSLHYGNFFH